MEELVTTEEAYIKDLKYVINVCSINNMQHVVAIIITLFFRLICLLWMTQKTSRQLWWERKKLFSDFYQYFWNSVKGSI